MLEALPDSAVLLDRVGTIVATNHHWRRFSAANDGTTTATGPGANYLRVCDGAAERCHDAAAVSRGITAVLMGRTSTFTHQYHCPTPDEDRWFTVRVSSCRPGALVSHLETTHIVTEAEALHERLGKDELTGLANRARVHQRLTDELATPGRGPRPAVLYLDLDGFKAVNDRHGHAAGDRVLRTVAQRLRRATRATDTVGRLGGDEFAVVTAGLRGGALTALRARVDTTLRYPHPVPGGWAVIPASVGVHVARLDEDAATVLHHADRAMYRVKHRSSTSR